MDAFGSSPRMSACLSNFVRLRPMPSGDSYMEEYEKQLKVAGSPKWKIVHQPKFC